MLYAVGYDKDKKELEVVFRSGKIWVYEDVPKDVYKELLESSSIGSFMRDSIIDCYSDYQL